MRVPTKFENRKPRAQRTFPRSQGHNRNPKLLFFEIIPKSGLPLARQRKPLIKKPPALVQTILGAKISPFSLIILRTFSQFSPNSGSRRRLRAKRCHRLWCSWNQEEPWITPTAGSRSRSVSFAPSNFWIASWFRSTAIFSFFWENFWFFWGISLQFYESLQPGWCRISGSWWCREEVRGREAADLRHCQCFRERWG